MKNRILVYAFILKLCWRSLFKINIGDTVRYQGKRYVLVQGVNDPLWHMQTPDNSERIEYVHRDKFSKERSLRNVIHDVSFTWDFYVGYWSRQWFEDPSQMRSWP